MSVWLKANAVPLGGVLKCAVGADDQMELIME